MKKRGNRLINEKSPYLLQHAENSVDWYPWDEEAFERAKKEDKPVFLSIGYATCHWCHVMAHESFEDEEVASLLNENFISIKLDREERPDIDHLYMTVCQALTGSGGWPLNVFLTPDKKPFFAGTYFPKHTRLGLPGIMDVAKQIARMWKEDKGKILKAGEDITKVLNENIMSRKSVGMPDDRIMKRAYMDFVSIFDRKWGGFGGAPKFPSPHQLMFLLRWGRKTKDANAISMVEKTLKAMRNGGIFDQFGYGFHRYSVDEKWLVPHFEKMLYDQAMLMMAYTEVFQATGKKIYEKVVAEISEYVLRNMTSPEGAFYCAEDADSEGKEGKFYVWTQDEVIRELGKEEGRLFCSFYGITERGNFERGQSIPNITLSVEEFAKEKGIEREKLYFKLEKCRKKMLTLRGKRPRPLLDDKILTSWNGLMIAALSKGGAVFDRKDLVEMAERTASFILSRLMDKNGRLFRRFRENEARFKGCLDDYSNLIWGLLELYEASLETKYLEAAIEITNIMLDEFFDEKSASLFYSPKSADDLTLHVKDFHDGAIPSATSVAIFNLLKLSRITGSSKYEKLAESIIKSFSKLMDTSPTAFSHMLSALYFLLEPGLEVVLVGKKEDMDTKNILKMIRRTFIPEKVILFKDPGKKEENKLSELAPFTKEMKMLEGKATVYICKGHSCMEPINDINTLEKDLTAYI